MRQNRYFTFTSIFKDTIGAWLVICNGADVVGTVVYKVWSVSVG